MAVFNKKILIGGVVALTAVGGVWYRSYSLKKQAPLYDTIRVVRQDLVQTVEATGKIEAVDDLGLKFEVPGIIKTVTAGEGQKVKTGAVLASLRLSELQAVVDQASATLRQRLAGATPEDKQYYEAAVVSAKAVLEQAKVDAANTVATAEAAVETARTNLKLAEGGQSSEIVTNAYDTAVASLQASLPKLDDAITQADNILGIDNTFANESFKTNLSVLNPNLLPASQFAYSDAKNKRAVAKSEILPLTTLSAHASVDSAFASAEAAFVSVNQLLTIVSDVLKATTPVGNLTQTSLDSKKTTIETVRTSAATQYATLVSQKQAVSTAAQSYNTYLIAYNKAQKDLAQAEANALSVVQIKQAAYTQAAANLALKVNPPREVDVAPLRAALAAAVANRDKAVITAPIDGVVAKVSKKAGEFVSSAETVIELISPHFEVSVDVPETDISKISIGQKADITLDAFGNETLFGGEVLSIEPGSTEIQDVVYYKVHIALSDTDKAIKPDMTANISLKTALKPGALVVPGRAVETENQIKRVRILVGGSEQKVEVVTGLRGNDGLVEVLSGLTEGDEVILSTLKK